MLQKLKIELIAEWRVAWKYMSVQFAALAVMFQTYLELMPGDAYLRWMALPPEIKSVFPEAWVQHIGLALMCFAGLSRFIKQKNVRKDN